MMLRNMVTSLLEHERIQTTLAKAKEVKRLAEKVIVLGKKGDLPARRQALAILTNKGVVGKLFSEIAPRYQDRQGGFTRVLKLGHRLGDAAPLSVVVLTESTAPSRPREKAETKKTTTRASSKTKKTAETKAKGKQKKPQEKRAKKVKELEG
jgi:large subunit ribosomal protein L17